MLIDLKSPPHHSTFAALRELRDLPGFKKLPDAELAFLEEFRAGTATAGAGKSIISEQKPNARLFTLCAGWAFRFKSLSDGRRQILNFLLPGDLIGLQQQFDEGPAHGVEALTEVALCVYPRDGLWELFKRFPSLAYDLTWLASREESMVDDNLLTAGKRTAVERVAMLLVHLYRRLEQLDMVQADGSVQFPLTQQHIADALGLSLVHTNKTLRRLEAMGLHQLKEGRLWQGNLVELEGLAEYYARPWRAVPLL